MNKKNKKEKKPNEKLILTKIQKKIISYVKNNSSSLNYHEHSLKLINTNKDLIQKIK